MEGGTFTCRLESCVKAFSQPGCAHLYGLSPVWILHGMRKEKRERVSARPLRDWFRNKPPQGHACPPTGVQAGYPGGPSLSSSLTQITPECLIFAHCLRHSAQVGLLCRRGRNRPLGSQETGRPQCGVQVIPTAAVPDECSNTHGEHIGKERETQNMSSLAPTTRPEAIPSALSTIPRKSSGVKEQQRVKLIMEKSSDVNTHGNSLGLLPVQPPHGRRCLL